MKKEIAMLNYSFSILFILCSFIGFAQKPLSDYTILELEQEKELAIKNEDFEKAAIYKKAIELKTELNSLITYDDYVAPPVLDNSPTQYGVADIYTGKSMSWFGTDFSLFKLSDVKLIGREQDMNKYIAAWQKVYEKEVPLSSLKRWFGKTNLKDYRSIGQEMHQKYLDPEWIIAFENTINEEMIQAQLNRYTVAEPGIGLVFMVENLNKKNRVMSGYFVWFDISSKQLLTAVKIFGKPSSGGMSSYWGKSFIPATKHYVDGVYRKDRAAYR